MELRRDTCRDVDDIGNVAVVRVAASGNAVDIESHFVPVGGTPERHATIKIDRNPTNMTVTSCQSGSTEFVAVTGVATLVSKDGGRSFAQIPGGHLVDEGHVECTDQLDVAGEHASPRAITSAA